MESSNEPDAVWCLIRAAQTVLYDFLGGLAPATVIDRIFGVVQEALEGGADSKHALAMNDRSPAISDYKSQHL